MLKDELLALEARQGELTALLAYAREPQPFISPNLAELYRRKVAELTEPLQRDETKTEAAEIIRSLLDEIVLVPEDRGFRIDLKGEFAGI